jgi:hypothetical protein
MEDASLSTEERAKAEHSRHVKNISEKEKARRTQEMKDKLEERKAQRLVEQKLKNTKALGESVNAQDDDLLVRTLALYPSRCTVLCGLLVFVSLLN